MESMLEYQVVERLKSEAKVEKTQGELAKEKRSTRSPFPWS